MLPQHVANSLYYQELAGVIFISHEKIEKTNPRRTPGVFSMSKDRKPFVPEIISCEPSLLFYLFVFCCLILLVFRTNDPELNSVLAQVETSVSLEMTLDNCAGKAYQVDSVERFILAAQEVTNNAQFENAWLCSDNNCVNISFPEENYGFQVDWPVVLNFLKRESNPFAAEKFTWVHNHPNSLPKFYEAQITPPPSDKDYFLHQELLSLIQVLDGRDNLQAVVLGNKGNWFFNVPNNNKYFFDNLDEWDDKKFEELTMSNEFNPEALEKFMKQQGVELKYEEK